MSQYEISVVMPALNEQANLELAVVETADGVLGIAAAPATDGGKHAQWTNVGSRKEAVRPIAT